MAPTAHRRKTPASPWRAAQGFITSVAVILGAVASVMLASQSTGTTPNSAAASNALEGSSAITLQSIPEWVNGSVTDVVTGRVTCALRQGSVFCWGRGGHGLGNGSGISSVPAPVSAANGFQNTGVTHITAGTSLGGNDHMCAVESGKAFCWGSGLNGQIGNGTFTRDNFVPRPVSVANGFHNATVTAIAAGGLHTCAIEEQRVFCWGSNTTGALGDGSTVAKSTPVAVMAQNGFQNSSVSAISAGYRHTCAIEEQRVFCWGANTTGALGDGTTTNKTTPVTVSAQNGFQNISVSAITTGKSNNTSGDQSHTCALENGAVWCWGSNNFGKLGDGFTTNQNRPITVSAVSGGFANTNVATISAGSYHTCAIEDSEAGAITYCWGVGSNGRLGTGLTVNSSFATVSAGFAEATHVSAGEGHTCGIKGGQVWCWGEDNSGSLGNGTPANRLTPTLVSAGSGCSLPNGAGTPSDPFLITSAADLVLVSGIADCYSKHFLQTIDIDLKDTTLTAPIGDPGTGFTGGYDGGGFTISNLVMDDEKDQGLFGRTDGATIRDVTLSATTVTATSSAGALIAHAVDTTVSGVNLIGVTVSAQQNDDGNSYAGGLIGYAENSVVTDVTMTDGTITGTGDYVGGLIGYLVVTPGGESSLSDLAVEGTVFGGGFGIGGLVGYVDVTTGAISLIVIGARTDTTVSGSSSAGGDVGGLIGFLGGGGGSATVSGTLVVGPTQGNDGVGGLIGQVFAGSGGQVVVLQSLAAGAVTGSALVGGLIGGTTGTGTLDASSSFWDVSVTLQPTSGGGGTGATTSDLITRMRIFVLAGWDIKPGSEPEAGFTWGFCPGSYPFLLAALTTVCTYAGDPSDQQVVPPPPSPSTTVPATTVPATTIPTSTVAPSVPVPLGPRRLPPPSPGTGPSSVSPSDGDQLQRPPGSGLVIVNGTPAATDVVIVTVPDAAVPADRRSPTQVQSVQRAAEQLVDEFLVAAPPGAEPLVSLLETDTGAVLIGVLVDPRTGATIPVPAENVVLVTSGNLRVLLAGADDMGRPAPVSNGVLEVTDGGVVSAVAYGLPPRVNGEVVMFSTPRLLGTFTTDDDGSFAGQMTLPDGLDPGAHTLVLAAGGLTSSLGLLVKAQGDVASPTVPTPGPGQLPATGEAPRTSLLLALVLISLGMVLASRRRSLGT